MPGYHYDGDYDGDDPDGFLPKDEIAGYLTGYAASFQAPVADGVEVHSVTAERGGSAAHLDR